MNEFWIQKGEKVEEDKATDEGLSLRSDEYLSRGDHSMDGFMVVVDLQILGGISELLEVLVS